MLYKVKERDKDRPGVRVNGVGVYLRCSLRTGLDWARIRQSTLQFQYCWTVCCAHTPSATWRRRVKREAEEQVGATHSHPACYVSECTDTQAHTRNRRTLPVV